MSEQSSLSNSATGPSQHRGARTTLASLAAIGSVLAASSCCLPILPLMMAAGVAGSSTFFSAARPYLLAARGNSQISRQNM
jgi:thiol:disulfide interchange protein